MPRRNVVVGAHNVPPLSLVHDATEGALYNRDINRINDVADIGGFTPAAAAERTWLATEYGVKFIDRSSGTSRLYGVSEGLPGTRVVAIVGDADAVWCLVRDRETVIADAKAVPKLHLCAYDAHADRWQERASLDAPYQRYVTTTGSPSEGRCLLSLSSRYVVVVGGVIPGNAATFALLYDRKSDKSTVIPPDADLGADTNTVLPTALLTDDQGVTVGSDHGLLRWNFASNAWTRLLPDRFVDCATSGDAGTVWVVSHPRLRPDERAWDQNPVTPDWNLTRVALANGATASWSPQDGATAPETATPTPIAPNSVGPGNRYGYRMVNPQADSRWPVPSGIFAEGNSVWTAHRATNTNFPSYNDPGVGWLNLDASTGAWTGLTLSTNTGSVFPNRPGQNPMGTLPFPTPKRDTTPGSGAHRHSMRFEMVPNEAVRALALRKNRPLFIEGRDNIHDDPEQYCILSRFPDWLSREASPKTDGVPAEAMSPEQNYSGSEQGPIAAPADGRRVWVVDEAGTNLVQCAPADLPPTLQGIRRPGYFVSSSRDGTAPHWEASPGVRAFPVPVLPVPPNPHIPARLFHPVTRIEQIVPTHRYVYCTLSAESVFAVARLDASTGKWTVYDPAKGIPNAQGAKLVGDGDEGAWLADTLGVYRYNHATDAWDHIFDTDVGHSPVAPTNPPIKPALLGTIGYNPQICGVGGGETDILLSRESDPQKHYLHRQMVCRFDNRDGHLIATLPYDKIDDGWGATMRATAQGNLWVGMNHGLFHVRRSASSGTAWQAAALPLKPVEGRMQGLYPAPNGGLWIVTSECAYLWKHPHA